MLVIIDLYSMNFSSFPPELNDILLPNQWDYIVYAVTEATKEGYNKIREYIEESYYNIYSRSLFMLDLYLCI